MNKELSILCIEDCESDFRLIERELRRAGMIGTCRRVDNHAALLEALANVRWDVVLSDYSVPGLSFIQTLGLLKRDWPELPLILVSATIGEVKAAAMVRLGTCAFVSKDYLEDLVPTIQRFLE